MRCNSDSSTIGGAPAPSHATYSRWLPTSSKPATRPLAGAAAHAIDHPSSNAAAATSQTRLAMCLSLPADLADRVGNGADVSETARDSYGERVGPPETLAAAGLAPDAYAALITPFSTVPEVMYFDVAALLIGRVAAVRQPLGLASR
jgi:hypothetical protein